MANARNLTLKDVVQVFDNINENGQCVRFKAKTTVDQISHFQGIIHYKDLAVVSHNNEGQDTGFLLIMDTEHEDGLRVETPQNGDYFNHPGGLQAIGDYFALAVEDYKHHNSRIYFYDMRKMSTKTAPTLLAYSIDRTGHGAASVGITNYTASNSKEKYLIAVHEGAGKIDFYGADMVDDFQNVRFRVLAQSILIPPYPDGRTNPDDSDDGMLYSSLSLLADQSGKVYMLGLISSNGHEEDYMELFQVVFDGDKPTEIIRVPNDNNPNYKFREVEMERGHWPGPMGVHFRWGSGIEILSQETIRVWATEQHITTADSHVDTNYLAPLVEVNFTVETGTASGAGTDSDIHMGLIGTSGHIDPFVINKLIDDLSALEKGHKDSFKVNLPDVGQLKELTIRSDQNWGGPDWQCKSVEIKYQNKMYRANVNSWFKDKKTHTYPLEIL